MWNYIWSRNRLLQRVVLNKRWRGGSSFRIQQFQRAQREFSVKQYYSRVDRNWSLRNLRKFKLRPQTTQTAQKRTFMSRVQQQLFRSQQKRSYQQQNQSKTRWQQIKAINTTFCIGIGPFIVKWTLDEVNLKVPTRREVDEESGFASAKNAAYVHGNYDELIEKYVPDFNDTDRMVIKNLDLILDGCDSYERNFWKGKLVCEIGSGTGILAFPIINRIGLNKRHGGGYIGLDISSAFVHYLDREFERRKLLKTRAIVGQNTPQSLCLPETLKNKVDVFVICDTFYHLDDRAGTLNEIYAYLKPNTGKLVVIESKSEEESVIKDLEGAGFTLGYNMQSDKFESQFVSIFNRSD